MKQAWIDHKEKVVYFHKEEDTEAYCEKDEATFWKYIDALVLMGYRVG